MLESWFVEWAVAAASSDAATACVYSAVLATGNERLRAHATPASVAEPQMAPAAVRILELTTQLHTEETKSKLLQERLLVREQVLRLGLI
jgi:hypothetical protein